MLYLAFILLLGLFFLGFLLLYNQIHLSFFVMSCYSIISVLFFAILNAHDVALTEGSLGAAVSAVFLLKSTKIIKNDEFNNFVAQQNKFSIDAQKILCLLKDHIFFIVFIFAALILEMHYNIFSDINFNHFHNSYLNEYFILNTQKEIGIKSEVAALLACYRGFDTLIETMVIFVGFIAIKMLNFITSSTTK